MPNKMTIAEKELYFWYINSGGDNFSAILYSLIAKADCVNREKLRQGFPEEVQAMYDFQNTDGYLENLRIKFLES